MIYYSLANEEVTAVIGMLYQLFCVLCVTARIDPEEQSHVGA